MSAREQDRGMRAVERARSVRERDSRIGLQRALAERNEHQARLTQLQEYFASGSGVTAADPSAFLAERAAMLAVGDAIADERTRLEASQQVADVAHAHWSGDKVRLSAVESLLERRAEVRRVERERHERTELDGVASQLWIRAQRAAERSPAERAERPGSLPGSLPDARARGAASAVPAPATQEVPTR